MDDGTLLAVIFVICMLTSPFVLIAGIIMICVGRGRAYKRMLAEYRGRRDEYLTGYPVCVRCGAREVHVLPITEQELQNKRLSKLQPECRHCRLHWQEDDARRNAISGGVLPLRYRRQGLQECIEENRRFNDSITAELEALMTEKD